MLTKASLHHRVFGPLYPLKIHARCCKWQDFISSYRWVVFHSTYVPHRLYPVIHQGTLGLFPCPGHGEQHCNEHRSAYKENITSNFCWVTGTWVTFYPLLPLAFSLYNSKYIYIYNNGSHSPSACFMPGAVASPCLVLPQSLDRGSVIHPFRRERN